MEYRDECNSDYQYYCGDMPLEYRNHYGVDSRDTKSMKALEMDLERQGPGPLENGKYPIGFEDLRNPDDLDDIPSFLDLKIREKHKSDIEEYEGRFWASMVYDEEFQKEGFTEEVLQAAANFAKHRIIDGKGAGYDPFYKDIEGEPKDKYYRVILKRVAQYAAELNYRIHTMIPDAKEPPAFHHMVTTDTNALMQQYIAQDDDKLNYRNDSIIPRVYKTSAFHHMVTTDPHTLMQLHMAHHAARLNFRKFMLPRVKKPSAVPHMSAIRNNNNNPFSSMKNSSRPTKRKLEDVYTMEGLSNYGTTKASNMVEWEEVQSILSDELVDDSDEGMDDNVDVMDSLTKHGERRVLVDSEEMPAAKQARRG